MKSPSDAAIAAAAELLDAHPDFRVIRRLAIHDSFDASIPGPLAIAVVIDTETTGTRHGEDRIIEVGIVRFEYQAETGRVAKVVGVYSGLEDPGIPIPPESTAIHGITDEMVAGQRLDESAIAAVVDGASLVIAHNASFDRPFLEERMPLFRALPWACSLEQVPWADEGFRGAKLEYLGWSSGFSTWIRPPRSDAGAWKRFRFTSASRGLCSVPAAPLIRRALTSMCTRAATRRRRRLTCR